MKRGIAVAARNEFMLSINLNSEFPWSYYSLYRISLAQDELALAIGYLKEAIDRLPMRAHLHYELGQLYLRIGDYSAAIESFRRAAQIEPAIAEYWHYLGLAYYRLGDNRSAMAYACRGLAISETISEMTLRDMGLSRADCDDIE